MLATSEKTASKRRQEIVNIATQAFLDKGFAGTSMTQLAKACGMQKASLYHHFDGKEALFIACVTDGYGRALKDLTELRDDESLSSEDRFASAILRLYDTTILSPVGRLSPLIAEVSRILPNVARSFHEGYIVKQRKLLEEIVQQGIADGSFVPMDRELLHHLVFGPIVTLSLSREMFATFDDLDTQFPVERLRDGHTEHLLKMLKAA
ncbi:TetR/AcrR family transcriptional regulator [Thalassococcus sp. S3]|uniref:TetR/AcrR family transcriptional regulator n=1 Tax=Thalassococcus sp. S3 TaxID=2017482 RepID=UPI0010244EF8|nr:TetR/AcrR family transcriptional regulator [Thalassococcus sp. S3]QBF33653.1 hypothetical protein CFI11_20900 [Thalassococcus sp. S3]